MQLFTSHKDIFQKKNDVQIGETQQNEKRSNLIRYVTHDVLSLADVTLFIYETSPIYQDEFRLTKTIHGDCSKGETRFDSVELSKRESNR